MEHSTKLYKEGKFEEALALLDKTIEFDANNANLISERAVVYFHLEDKQRALKELDYCVLLEPSNPYRYSSRAYVKAALKDIKGAIADYEKCVQLDPEDAIAHNNLGLLLESLGRMEQAKRNFNRADELEGVLKERGIDLPEVEEDRSSSDQKTSENPVAKEGASRNTWSIVKGTFTDKNLFKEYLQFLKNGLKIKGKKDE